MGVRELERTSPAMGVEGEARPNWLTGLKNKVVAPAFLLSLSIVNGLPAELTARDLGESRVLKQFAQAWPVLLGMTAGYMFYKRYVSPLLAVEPNSLPVDTSTQPHVLGDIRHLASGFCIVLGGALGFAADAGMRALVSRVK